MTDGEIEEGTGDGEEELPPNPGRIDLVRETLERIKRFEEE